MFVDFFFIRMVESNCTPVGFIFALDNLQGFHKLLWLRAVQSALYFHGVLKNQFTVITLYYIYDTPFMQLTYMFFLVLLNFLYLI
jgi:hypothetical protein